MSKQTWVQVKTPDGPKLIPKDQYVPEGPKGPFVFGDIKPYRAVTGDMCGKWITSRSQHRDFLRRNNLVEVGNEKTHMTRHGGMSSDNPWLNEKKHEESVTRSVIKNLERLRSR